MSVSLDPSKRYFGALCARHPEMEGLRHKSNNTCIQCQRDRSAARLDRAREAAGRTKLVPMSPEQAKERVRLRDLARNAKRRKMPEYNEAQVVRKRAWRAENRDHHLAVSRAYEAKQRAENLQRRISKNLRCRIRKAMLGETRGVSAVRDLGMSIADFREYIAARFQPGMSWKNYGEWHLDHIRPLAEFDLTDADQARKACHYSNLQPLWAIDNQRKWCKPQSAGAQALAYAT